MIFLIFSLFVNKTVAGSECIIIKNPEQTDSTSKFEIEEPGYYCLDENLHARFDLAHHSPEGRLIRIRSSDVVLDLRNHILGRGILFKNPGGVAIEINANLKNITVKNGTVQDFDVGFYRGIARYTWGTKEKILKPIYDPETKTFSFERDNIVITNVRFINNKIDMKIKEKE